MGTLATIVSELLIILYITYMFVEGLSIIITTTLHKLGVKVCAVTFMSKLYIYNILMILIGCPLFGYLVYFIISHGFQLKDKWELYMLGSLLFFSIQFFTSMRTYDILRYSMGILNITNDKEFSEFRNNTGEIDD
jgi:hypothetical protein